MSNENITFSSNDYQNNENLLLPSSLNFPTTMANNSLDRPITPLQGNTCLQTSSFSGSGIRQKGGFLSPAETPQGSPSKRLQPPGSYDLAGVFDQTMKLLPLSTNTPPSPSKSTPWLPQSSINTSSPENSTERTPHSTSSPTSALSGSPTRVTNKENAPFIPRFPPIKEHGFQGPTASTKKEFYHKTRDALDFRRGIAASKSGIGGLSPDELILLQKPSVRRLANVTQLYFLDYYYDLLNYIHTRKKRLAQFEAENPPPPATPQDVYSRNLTQYLGRERANLRKRRTRLRHGDFHILTQVGQGGYGQVYLAQKKDTREVCALKVMSKKLLFKLDEVRHVLTERDILTSAKSEWLVRLLYAFQDETNIYLAMEYVPGGDFRTLLNNTGVLHNRLARFYISEMFQCVDALHQLGYIHRDLKPENFLIDGSGHVKLTDFGLAAGFIAPGKIESMRIKLESVGDIPIKFARPMEERTVAERRNGYRSLRERDVNYAKSIVGSPDYMAPEVLRGEEYDFTVDYWSLGCMLFEALAGFPPFAGSTVEETWQNLKHWKQVLKKPVYEDQNYFLSHRTWNLITRLVASKDSRFRGINEIRSHAYFAEVDWARLKEQRAPFVPELDSETDAGYFDDFSSEADMAKYKEVHEKQMALEKMAERDEKMSKSLFVGFTFRHRKTATDENGKPQSPRKPLPTSDGSFGTTF